MQMNTTQDLTVSPVEIAQSLDMRKQLFLAKRTVPLPAVTAKERFIILGQTLLIDQDSLMMMILQEWN